MVNEQQNLIQNAANSPPLTDFELSKVTRLFEILITLDKRAREQNDLRTDNPK